MDNHLTIDFAGLCVFVTKNAPEKLSVILAADPTGTMRHRPILSFNVRNLSKLSAGSVDQVIQLPNGDQIASWHLDKKIVRLVGTRGADPGKVVLCTRGAPTTRCPQDPASEMDLCWVPSLKRVSGHGDINSVYLTDNPVHPSGETALAARVDIESGYLYANAEVNRQTPAEAWTFDDGSGSAVTQYLADTVRLEVRDISAAPIVIEVSEFGDGSKETLELVPWNHMIELAITNLPDASHHDAHDPTRMPHFAFYYELLDPVPQRKPIPTRPSNATCRQTPGTEDMETVSPGDMGVLGVQPVRCTPTTVP